MKILWISSIWPEPDSSAAGFRTMQLIEACADAGYSIRVSSPAQSDEHQARLESQGIYTDRFEPNDSRFDTFIKAYNPDVVFFDRFMIEEQFSWRVREQCPDALRVIDTIDLHSLRRARERKVKITQSVSDLSNSELRSIDAMREVSSILRSDLSLIISDFELSLLIEHYNIPKHLISLCRYYYDPPQSLKTFEQRSNIATIGNFNHAPNVDSIFLLHRTLWPSIRSALSDNGVDNPELHIYGAYPTQELLSLDNPETGFRVKGWAKNAIETLSQYRLSVAPLRFGAGIKGKISDSWAAGTPCVATSIGSEGMHESLPFGGIIEDDFEQFCHKLTALYTNSERWNQAQQDGIQTIIKLYNKEFIINEFLSKISEAIANRDQRRVENFMGSILWHQTNRSTEYFSKWIEEKNKRRKEEIQHAVI